MVFVKAFDRLCRMPKWFTLERVLSQAVAAGTDLFFVQIGANDGVIYDPIYPFVQQSNWRGVLVEPVRTCFERLKQNYNANDRLIFENVAISDRREVRDFYRIRDNIPFLPEWCKGLGTFDLDILMTHTWAVPDLARYVVKEQMECISLTDLLEMHHIKKLDLLLVDTEGYDYEILEQIDFETMAPAILLYEHQYIDKRWRGEWEMTLRDRGYRISRHFGNTLAYFPPV